MCRLQGDVTENTSSIHDPTFYSVLSQPHRLPQIYTMSSAELANQLVFASVGPFVTSLWLAGDWGLTSTIFLIGQYLIRLPVFAEETNLAWPVFNDLTSFWNYTMIGFLIIGSAMLGTFIRLVLKIPNVVHIRKIFYTKGDRNQHKFLVPSNGTIILMLFFGLAAIGGTLVFHDIFIQENEIPLLAVIATPAIIAALYLIVYFIMMWAFDNEQGVALWGYDTENYEQLNRVEESRSPNFVVMRRALFAVAAHHILLTVAVDLAIIFSRNFMTTFIVATASLGALFVIDIIIYAFWLRTINDYAPAYEKWVVELTQGAINNDDLNLDGVDDGDQFESFNSKAIPMSRLSGSISSKTPPVTAPVQKKSIFVPRSLNRL